MVPRPCDVHLTTPLSLLGCLLRGFLGCRLFGGLLCCLFGHGVYPLSRRCTWPAARRHSRALATLSPALTAREWRKRTAVRYGRRMAGGHRSSLVAAACPTDGHHRDGTRCGLATKRRSREPTTASSRPSSWPSERPSSPRPSWLPSSPFFLLGWRCSFREPSLAHHYRWIELPCLTQDVDYG